MKAKIKQAFKIIFGTDENILFKLNISILISIAIFTLFSFLLSKGTFQANFFTLVSTVLLCIWIILTRGGDTFEKFAYETVRLFAFLLILLFSLDACYSFYSSKNKVIIAIFIILGILFCSYYFVSKLSDIFDFVKRIFLNIKIKLFNSKEPATSKTKSLIENVTAFLVSIGALAIAIRTITDTIFQIINSFNK